MPKRRAEKTPLRTSRRLPATAFILAGFFLAISTAVVPSLYEAWRTPKELLFRGEAIILLLVGVFVATSAAWSWRNAARRASLAEWTVCGSIALWTAITTLTSTNRLLSEDSLVTVLAALVIWIATRMVSADLPLAAIDFCLVAAAINSLLTISQEFRIWNPLQFISEVGHMRTTALIGNPNDIGTFLVGPAVAAVVGAAVAAGRRRVWYSACATVIIGGVVASATRTAIISFAVAMAVFAFLGARRQALLAGGILLLVALAALAPSTTVRENFISLYRAAKEGRIDVISSQRMVPFLTAVEMARKHPVFGVGPGCFKFQFMEERIGLSAHYPRALTQADPQMFGETHDDHLQITAETGIPGYLIFLAAILVLVRKEPRHQEGGAPPLRQRFGEMLRAPLVTAFFVVCFAQFPLQIAGPRLMFITLLAIMKGWADG